jgi:hypothetical protein
MLKNKVSISIRELEVINKIVEENTITDSIDLVIRDGSGVGYTLDLEFETVLNDRTVTVRIPVATINDW